MFPLLNLGVADYTSSMGTGFSGAIAEAWHQVGEVVTTITSTPVLMIPVAIAFAGAAIGLAKRLMGTGRRRR